MADSMVPVRIVQMRYEAESVLSLELRSLDDAELPAFAAGAHIDVQISDGCSRPYSLLNDPAERSRYVVAVNKDPDSRGGSRAIHERARVGDIIRVSHPRNNFPLNETAAHSVFIVGGIGVTPVLCMIRRLAALGRSWEVHYAARRRQTAAFLAEINDLARSGNSRVHLCFKSEPGGEALDIAETILKGKPDAHFYCCGPVRMLKAFEDATGTLAPERIHIEYFAAKQEAAADGGYELVLARSRKTVEVPVGKTMLQALLDAKVNVNYACSQGVCGSCITRVIEGRPDHRDGYLTDEEKAQNQLIMVCCSGSQSPTLVLDL